VISCRGFGGREATWRPQSTVSRIAKKKATPAGAAAALKNHTNTYRQRWRANCQMRINLLFAACRRFHRVMMVVMAHMMMFAPMMNDRWRQVIQPIIRVLRSGCSSMR
jgi:hypothetical protein